MKNIFNTPNVTINPEFKNFILSNIEFEGYDNLKKYKSLGFNLNPNANEEKILIGLGLFSSEYLHNNNERQPKRTLFVDYLQGLPSWINIPFYYYDIRNLLYSLGYEVQNLDDSDLSTLYYQLITNVFFQ